MGRLTKEQKEFYKNNGYIVLKGLFTKEEMNVISEEYNRIFYKKTNADIEGRWKGSEVEKTAQTKDYTVHSVHNLQLHSAVFSKLLLNENLLDAVEDVMDTPDILLHHTKAHNKPPGKGAPFPMHQDYHYFPYKKDSMVAAFVHVDSSSPQNGGLCVYPGSHKLGPQEDLGATESGGVYHYMNPKEFSLENAEPVEAEAGDVVIFSYLLIHGSYNNTSDRTRRMFLIQMMSAHDEPLLEHPRPGQGWVLRGRNDQKKADFRERHLH